MQNQQLLSQSKILEDQILAGLEGHDDPAYEVTEQSDHGREYYRNGFKTVVAKLLDLWVRQVLRNDNLALPTSRAAAGARRRPRLRRMPNLSSTYSRYTRLWLPPLRAPAATATCGSRTGAVQPNK